MKITYVDIPTNFVSPRKSKHTSTTQQQFHQMSVPVIQIAPSEIMKYSQEVEKQAESQKLLKRKLKALEKVVSTNHKIQVDQHTSDMFHGRLSPNVVIPRNPHFQNKDQQFDGSLVGASLVGSSSPIVINENNEKIAVDAFSHRNPKEIHSRSLNQSPHQQFTRSKFSGTPAQLNKPSSSPEDLRGVPEGFNVEGLKNRPKYMRDSFSPLPQSMPVHIFGPLKLVKHDEFMNLSHSKPVLEREKSLALSKSTGFFAAENKPKKPSMLSFLKNGNPPALLNTFHISEDKETSVIKPELKPLKLLKQFESKSARIVPNHELGKKILPIMNFHASKTPVQPNAPKKEDTKQTLLQERPSLRINLVTPLASSRHPSSQEPLKPVQKSSRQNQKRKKSEAGSKTQSSAKQTPVKANSFTQQMEALVTKINNKMKPMDYIFNKESLDEADPSLKALVAKAQEDLPPITRRTLEFIIIRKRLLQRLKKIKGLKLTLKEVLENDKIFSSGPYEKEGSKEFFMAVKLGDIAQMKDILTENGKFLVYDYDHVQLTALHWAVKKGYTNIVHLLIEKGANIDAKDIIGRTPLYFAIKANNLEILKILLANQAKPWSSDETNYREICKNDESAIFYLNKMKKLDINTKMMPPSEREEFWKRESEELLLHKRFPNEEKFKAKTIKNFLPFKMKF